MEPRPDGTSALRKSSHFASRVSWTLQNARKTIDLVGLIQHTCLLEPIDLMFSAACMPNVDVPGKESMSTMSAQSPSDFL